MIIRRESEKQKDEKVKKMEKGIEKQVKGLELLLLDHMLERKKA